MSDEDAPARRRNFKERCCVADPGIRNDFATRNGRHAALNRRRHATHATQDWARGLVFSWVVDPTISQRSLRLELRYAAPRFAPTSSVDHALRDRGATSGWFVMLSPQIGADHDQPRCTQDHAVAAQPGLRGR